MGLTSKDTFVNGYPVPLTGGSTEVIYKFSVSLAAGAPATGAVTLNNSTQNIATLINVSTTDFDGIDWQTSIDFFCSSTSLEKGQILLRGVADPTKFLVFKFTAITTPSSGARTLTIQTLSSSGTNPFIEADVISVTFFRTGDKGDAGTGGSGGTSGQASVTTTNSTLIDSWAVATYRSAKYTVQIADGTNFETAEIMLIHDGAQVFMTTFGNVFNGSGSLGIFDASLAAGTASLTFTASVATNKTVKFVRNTINA